MTYAVAGRELPVDNVVGVAVRRDSDLGADGAVGWVLDGGVLAGADVVSLGDGASAGLGLVDADGV